MCTGRAGGSVDENCGALLDRENKSESWSNSRADEGFLVLEIDVGALQAANCNFATDPDGRPGLDWVCSAVPKDCVLHEFKVVAVGEGRPHFDSVNRESKCPFPFIYAHDPAQAWKQHPGKTVVTVIVLAALYYCTGRWLRQAARKGIDRPK